MPGGRGAVYVRAGRRAGKVVVTAKAPRLKDQRATIVARASRSVPPVD